MSVKVLLADDRHRFRHSFRQQLSALPEARLVEEVDDCLEIEALSLMVKPDVIVVNLEMRGSHGRDQVRSLCQALPGAKIIAISRKDDEVFIIDLLRSGALGFLPSSSDAAEAVLAVRHVIRGVRYISPVAADRLFSLLIDKTTYFFTEPYQKLTRREREVFHLTAEGFSGPEIAARLTISPRTVELHRSNLLRKLGLSSQRDLIRYAVQSGVLPLDEQTVKQS